VEDIQAATAALIALRGTMKAVKPLSDVQRRDYYRQRLGPQNAARPRQPRDRGTAASTPAPALVRPAEVRAGYGHGQRAPGMLAAVDQLRTTVQDAWLPVVSRAVQAGSVAYAHIKASPGAEEQIKSSVGKLSINTRAHPASPASESEPPATAPAPAAATGASPTPASTNPASNNPESKAA